MTIKTIEDLDESRPDPIADFLDAVNEQTTSLRARAERAEAEVERLRDLTKGLPPGLIVSLIRLHAADPASVTAIGEVITERLRQIEGEGWTLEHDDRHSAGEMAMAGASYAIAAQAEDWWKVTHSPGYPSSTWPWDRKWWKPSTPARDKVKGAALIIAERAKEIRAGNRESQP